MQMKPTFLICSSIISLFVTAVLLIQAEEPAAEEVVTEKVAVQGRTKTNLPPDGYRDTELIQGQKYRVHDMERPEPWIVQPGAEDHQAPSDALVLFDGTDMSAWVTPAGEPAAWKVENGYMEVNGTGSIKTKENFGDCQLHLEWACPAEVVGTSQGRGNSGVFLMDRYEIQILDSFENRTYSDGQAGAIYGQFPPLVNASRGPGEWQSFDIIFEAPVFEVEAVKKPAYFTILHNGVLLHHRTAAVGPVKHKDPTSYVPHEAALPIGLQDHGNPTRFRNIWLRRLTPYDAE